MFIQADSDGHDWLLLIRILRMISKLATDLPGSAEHAGSESDAPALNPTVWLRDHHGEVARMPLPQLRIEHVQTAAAFRRFRSRRGQKHMPGIFFSTTVNRHVTYESLLELPVDRTSRGQKLG